jgi:hypothetical protein
MEGPEVEFQKHVLERLGNLEAELQELRQVTWPVCQGTLDARSGGIFKNMKDKMKFFKFIDIDEMRKLLKAKCLFMDNCPTLAIAEAAHIKD